MLQKIKFVGTASNKVKDILTAQARMPVLQPIKINDNGVLGC